MQSRCIGSGNREGKYSRAVQRYGLYSASAFGHGATHLSVTQSGNFRFRPQCFARFFASG